MTEESPASSAQSPYTQTPSGALAPRSPALVSDNLVCVLWIKRRTRKRVYLDLKMQFGLFFFSKSSV